MATPILYVHHRPEASGAAQSLALLIGSLDERFTPHALVPGGPAAKLLADAGATVHVGPVSTFTHTWDVRYEGARWAVLGREIARLPAHARSLSHVLDEVSPAVVHVNDAVMLAAGRIAHGRGVPVVWHLRTSLADGGRGDAVARRLDRWGAAAIAIDTDVLRSYPVSLPTAVVPNPVAWAGKPPRRATEEERSALGIPAGCVSIGFFGYLRRQKGWPELVLAAERLDRAGVPFHVVVVGGGVRSPGWYQTPRGRASSALRLATDEETEMRRLVHDRDLDGRFSFLPFAGDVRAIYAALDIVTFPNTGAGLGRPVLEASAAGVPVVAAGSVDGAGIVLPDETGILLGHLTPDSLADALASLVQDGALRDRLGARAVVHGAELFGSARCAAKVGSVYAGILPSSPAQRHGADDRHDG